MRDKRDREARDAMRKVLDENNGADPKEISTDLGGEFGPAFQGLLQDRGVAFRQKDPQQINALAGVDRTQQSIKSILKNFFLKD